MNAVGIAVEARRAALKAISSPKTHVVEFDITGGWFGSRWGRDRHFAWVIHVALTTEGECDWTDHAEHLVRRS